MAWFHASASELEVGAVLVPGPSGFVFVSSGLDTAHDWAHLLGSPYVYEVKPVGVPVARPQKDALGGREWLVTSATVSHLVGRVRHADEYCDGCLPSRSRGVVAAPPRRSQARGR